MEHKIKLLSNEVIGQIAAGEVVERPSAAIKELIENAMDAEANAITIEIKEGGLHSFRVTDNGKGIPPSEIRLAFERHATSKIRTAEDLYNVETLGFRGEALASIAAVSHVKCTSKARGFDVGVTLLNSGGVITDIQESACPEGTTFLMKELFFNAPVRKKFLKKPSIETSYVTELVAKLILSHPDVSFRYIADGKTVYFSAGDGKLQTAVLSVYGIQTLKALMPVKGNMNGILFEGYIGIGENARGNRAHQHFFLNKRAMKSMALSNALEEACKQRVMIGRFPLCVLHLTMPYGLVDVNVHPNKWEVRFSEEKKVKQALTTVVEEMLLDAQIHAKFTPSLFVDKETSKKPTPSVVTAYSPQAFAEQQNVLSEKPKISQNLVPQTDIKDSPQQPLTATTIEQKNEGISSSIPFVPPVIPEIFIDADENKPATLHESVSATFIPPPPPMMPTLKHEFSIHPTSAPVAVTVPVSAPSVQLVQKEVEEKFEKEPPRVLGVAFRTYIIFEHHNELLLCDQHAAHERILFEKFSKKMQGNTSSQTLLLPKILNLSQGEYDKYLAHEALLLKMGFDVVPFGDLQVQLRGAPLVFSLPKAEDYFICTLDELQEKGFCSEQEKVDAIIQQACKHAIKGGEKVSMQEITHIVHCVLSGKLKPTCPHGRPLFISLTEHDLEKRFKRI